MKGINISSNQLTDNDMNEILLQLAPQNMPLLYLNISCNQVHSMKSLAMSLSLSINVLSLKVLDLSYNECLTFQSLSFYPLFNLEKLVLDGCGIKSTLVSLNNNSNDDDDDDSNNNDDDINIFGFNNINYFDSIFSGLINLKELSLKENQLKNTPFSLNGLLFFSLDDNSNSDSDTSNSSSKLMILSIEDNPVCESSKVISRVTETLVKLIPSLSSINNKKYRPTEGTMDVVSILKKGQSSSSSSSSSRALSLSEKGFENMEKEYLSALKGERENTVVS